MSDHSGNFAIYLVPIIVIAYVGVVYLTDYMLKNYWDFYENDVGNIASQNFANQVHYGESVRAILYYPGMRETAIWFSEEAILLERLAEIIRGGL